ncbi:MAG TPA: helix-turn-helix domain-containing protein [Actinomycetales bacterium]|nr:helix-turn-helix domain-containing protein [Actinomycetales bacterium]
MTDIKKGARLIGDDRTRMAERVTAQYNEGRSIREIAQETGRSYGFVHRVLSESEVALRGRGGPTRRKRE